MLNENSADLVADIKEKMKSIKAIMSDTESELHENVKLIQGFLTRTLASMIELENNDPNFKQTKIKEDFTHARNAYNNEFEGKGHHRVRLSINNAGNRVIKERTESLNSKLDNIVEKLDKVTPKLKPPLPEPPSPKLRERSGAMLKTQPPLPELPSRSRAVAKEDTKLPHLSPKKDQKYIDELDKALVALMKKDEDATREKEKRIAPLTSSSAAKDLDINTKKAQGTQKNSPLPPLPSTPPLKTKPNKPQH